MMLQLWYDDNDIVTHVHIPSLTLCVSLQVFIGQNLRYEVGSLSSDRGGSGDSTALAAAVGVSVPLLLIALVTSVGIILFFKFRNEKTGLVS